ncbi:hypothetical protein BGZ70_009134 [Mortierella alpina]|uniref:Uncharacterized protein n=1 Tax=Mortierella alpina TaxID=64518 RepID=A0A9P6J578_MORAP|nr:hypothetical protein BGZ70_009134 [Mortierella alpina]
MAVALLPKKKSKNRSRQRSASPRAFEEEDEDMVIISRLEQEPWQPDLLLERRSDTSPVDERFKAHETTASSSLATALTSSAPGTAPETEIDTSTGPAGFQGVIPVIIKSPSSVITTADSDCVDSIFEDHAPKISGIQEYLQHTQQEQQRQQEETQRQKEKLQYQLPSQFTRQQRQHPDPAPYLYRNSFHGEASPFLDEEEQPTLDLRRSSVQEPQPADKSTLEKVIADSDNVIESLQSLKHLAMLALDGLLQQVVSEVTSSDPAHNPDETTLQARAMIRRKSYPLLGIENGGQDQEKDQGAVNPKASISNTPIAGMAASSLERLDELARKVDQLAVVATEEQATQPQGSPCETRDASAMQTNPTAHIRSSAPQESQPQQSQQPRLDPSQVFESQEYQLACALAALLACTYRILNRLQDQPDQQEQPRRGRLPSRTESADSGLDQAAKLWKRLSSNSFARNSHSSKNTPLPGSSLRGDALSSSAEPRASISSDSIMSNSGTNGFMQSINKQVRTLRSRRTQSTSQIEVPHSSSSRSLLDPAKRLGGGGRLFSTLGMSSPLGSAKQSSSSEAGAENEQAKELEHDWTELDRLMEEMSHLWLFVECLEDDPTRSTATTTATATATTNDKNPFHDRHQIPSQPTRIERAAVDTSLISSSILDFDLQTLDLSIGEDLPRYDEHSPQYKTLEKLDSTISHPGQQTLTSTAVTGPDDEKTRFDLNNVMSAIERLSKVAPRLDNQRVQLSTSQKRQMAQAHVAHTIERLSKGRWEDQRADVPTATQRTRDLNGLVSQIVESARASYSTQRAELSPKQQWKLEGARIGDKIEQSVLLKDMTRLTSALYQQSSSSKAFATQRFTVSEDKAKNMALQGIISKIERVSGRRLENQDAMPPPLTHKSKSGSVSGSVSSEKQDYESSKTKEKELQEMMNQVAGVGGGAKRKTAMASQRAEFHPGK